MIEWLMMSLCHYFSTMPLTVGSSDFSNEWKIIKIALHTENAPKSTIFLEKKYYWN